MEERVTWKQIEEANKSIRPLSIARKTSDGKQIVKKYAEVNQRIKAFRKVYPTATIKTTLESDTDNVCTFRAEIYYNGELLATGTAREDKKGSVINQKNYIENCETSAVGRALGMCGFGIDTSLASADEVQNAIAKEQKTENGPLTTEQMVIITNLSIDQKDHIRDTYKKENLMKLTYKEAEEIINSLKKHGLIKTKEEKIKEVKSNTEVF